MPIALRYQMLNNCKNFGNYFSIKSFRFTFAPENFSGHGYVI